MIKKISIKDLRPGMTVARMNSDLWHHCPTLFTTEGPVETAEDVLRIVDAGYTEVFIEVQLGDRQQLPIPATSENQGIGEVLVAMSEELFRAKEIYATALATAQALFTAVSKGQPMDMAAANSAVETLNGSLKRSPAALNCLARLGNHSAYLYSHSVNVSVLSMFVARSWGFAAQEVHEIGLAGLFHDLGKTRLPIGLLNQRARLSVEESKSMEGHCIHGLAILEIQRDVVRSVKRAVVEHHERHDGSGYPFGLKGDHISPMGRVLSLADCFDALTSQRTYKESLPPSKALSILYGMRDHDFSSEDVERFIKCIGIYPTGSLVRLSNGQLAVVCETDPEVPMSPVVNVVLDKRLHPIPSKVINLADVSGQGEGSLKIQEYLDVRDLPLDPLQLLFLRKNPSN